MWHCKEASASLAVFSLSLPSLCYFVLRFSLPHTHLFFTSFRTRPNRAGAKSVILQKENSGEDYLRNLITEMKHPQHGVQLDDDNTFTGMWVCCFCVGVGLCEKEEVGIVIKILLNLLFLSGEDVVSWMESNLGLSPQESVEYGQKLVKEGVIEHVAFMSQQDTMKVMHDFENNETQYRWVVGWKRKTQDFMYFSLSSSKAKTFFLEQNKSLYFYQLFCFWSSMLISVPSLQLFCFQMSTAMLAIVKTPVQMEAQICPFPRKIFQGIFFSFSVFFQHANFGLFVMWSRKTNHATSCVAIVLLVCSAVVASCTQHCCLVSCEQMCKCVTFFLLPIVFLTASVASKCSELLHPSLFLIFQVAPKHLQEGVVLQQAPKPSSAGEHAGVTCFSFQNINWQCNCSWWEQWCWFYGAEINYKPLFEYKLLHITRYQDIYELHCEHL